MLRPRNHPANTSSAAEPDTPMSHYPSGHVHAHPDAAGANAGAHVEAEYFPDADHEAGAGAIPRRASAGTAAGVGIGEKRSVNERKGLTGRRRLEFTLKGLMGRKGKGSKFGT